MQDFKIIIEQQLGADADKFFEALQEPQSVSVRVNSKVDAADLTVLQGATSIPYCSSGYSLPSRPDFTLDPMLHGGAYYVQEASSMYLEQIVKKYVDGAVRCLDLCAAPGGKSTHLAQLLSPDSLLICNEVMPQRANVLTENITKWGNSNTIVTNNKPSDFKRFGDWFDVVVADVPCSGEGMFRKEPKAVEDWSLDLVKMCADRQRNILEDIWGSLREGGLFVYSTCTFNHLEDEDNVDWIARELGAEILEQRHFYFHQTLGEGFYIAALRKTSRCESSLRIKTGKDSSKERLKTPFTQALHCAEKYSLVEFAGGINSVPAQRRDEFRYVADNLRTLACGTALCTFKGRDEIPAHALAVSKALNKNAVECHDADFVTAIQYLKREAVIINGVTKGYVLICYNGLPLGWVKNLGTRCNNLYPEYWRIRK